MPAQFKTLNVRGICSKVLVDDQGYTYSNSMTKSGNFGNYWRCSKKNKKCKASITTDHEWVVIKRQKHNHEPPENS